MAISSKGSGRVCEKSPVSRSEGGQATSTAAPSGRSRPAGAEREIGKAALRKGRRSTRTVYGLRLALLAVVLGAWQYCSDSGLVNAFFVSSPSRVAQRAWTMVTTGDVFPSLRVTLQETAVGLILAIVAGLVIGLFAASLERVGRVLDPFIAAAYNVPHLALGPLLILFFGLGMTSKIALAFLASFFYIFYNVVSGVRSMDRALIETVRIMGGSRRQVLRLITIPSILVWLFAALRLAVRGAFAGAVVGELLASTAGIGYLVEQSAGAFDATGTFAALLFIVIVAVILNAVIGALEGRFSRWQTT